MKLRAHLGCSSTCSRKECSRKRGRPSSRSGREIARSDAVAKLESFQGSLVKTKAHFPRSLNSPDLCLLETRRDDEFKSPDPSPSSERGMSFPQNHHPFHPFPSFPSPSSLCRPPWSLPSFLTLPGWSTRPFDADRISRRLLTSCTRRSIDCTLLVEAKPERGRPPRSSTESLSSGGQDQRGITLIILSHHTRECLCLSKGGREEGERGGVGGGRKEGEVVFLSWRNRVR